MPVTEIVSHPCTTLEGLTDRNTTVGKAQHEAAKIVLRQPGLEHSWYGVGVEDPDEMYSIINWTRREDHTTFTQSEDIKTVFGLVGQYLKSFPTPLHFNFDSQPSLTSALNAPVTEMATMYKSAQTEAYVANAQKFAAVVKEAKGFHGIAVGWSLEDVEHEKLGEGKTGKVLKMAIGWDSVDAHMQFRETEAFKDNIALLTEGMVASDVKHIRAQDLKTLG